MAFPGVGDLAPDFVLPGTDNRPYKLSGYLGRPVLLVFYPGDNTRVCTVQLRSYSVDMDKFADVGVEVLGVSPQGVESHHKFADANNITFPLLADEDKEVGRTYGVVGPLGFYRRSVFLVDGEGVVRYAHRSSAGLTFKSPDELLEAIRAALAPARS